MLRVKDDGAGIDPTLLPYMFELFVQGSQGPRRRLWVTEHYSHVDRAEKLRAADQVVALAGLRATPANDTTVTAPNAPASGGSGGGLNE